MGTHGLNEVQLFCEVFISGNLFLLSVADEDDKKKWRRQKTDIYRRNSLSHNIDIDRWNSFFGVCYNNRWPFVSQFYVKKIIHKRKTAEVVICLSHYLKINIAELPVSSSLPVGIYLPKVNNIGID